VDGLRRDGHETASAPGISPCLRSRRAIYTFAVNRTLVFPQPIPTKDLPDYVRRAMRAFERVHKMLEAKAAAERVKAKRPGR